MEDSISDTGGGSGGGGIDRRPTRGVRGIHRRKHALRAAFRTSFLVLLVGGYALHHRLGGRSPGGGTPMIRSDYGLVDQEQEVDGRRSEGANLHRMLEEEVGEDAPCSDLEVADSKWSAALYAVGTLYMFLALAIVCDEYFVPALEEMSSESHLNLSMDVAGATLMAAGGSAPELFTSFVGTFKQSDIGIGTIVGSAVFNVLFVIGTCSLLSKEVLTLTWWPLFRDSACYAVGLVVLSLLVGVFSEGVVHWWEALILFAMYLGYVAVMYYNRRLYKRLTGKELVLPGENDEDNDATSERADASAKEIEMGSAVARSAPLLTDAGGAASAAPDFRWPGTFRAGILTLLVHRESWKEKGGVGIVTKIQGDVDRVFEQVDVNADGAVDLEELGMLFRKLGHEINEEDLRDVFRSLDLDGNGLIEKEEFRDWYTKSEERILSKVKPIFDTFDTDKSGTIDRHEIGNLLETLDVEVTETDVDDAVKAMYQSGHADQITYEEFSDWFVEHVASRRRLDDDENEGCAGRCGQCEALSPPRGEGAFAWLTYLVVLPLVATMALTIPDVRRPGYGKWCYASFVVSIAWIGVFSYFMVNWVELLGNTMGIPPVVMGYTVLAAGTSVPDLFSSVIVARMGQGDMAVSSSLGSNIFDILVGLPLPWLAFTLWPSTPNFVVIQATGIWQSIFILMGMIVAIIAIVHCQGWKMTRTLGGLMFLLYFLFLAQAILTEYFQNPCFG